MLLCILFFSPSLLSCRHHPSHDHDLDTVAINPAFAKDPPIQISPATSFGSPAFLSGFLTGITVTDPAEIPGVWQFADLKRRAQDLIDLVNSSCTIIPIHFHPLNMAH